jgi:uncharacterized membrane protein YgaE (UPF0421/DUF939 family)
MAAPSQNLVIYIVKCVIGTLAVFAISSLIHYKNLGWALISVILVLSPEGDDTVNIAINRIKANVIGAGVGLFCLLTGYSNMWTMCLAVTITLVASHYFNLDTSTRSALAATVIIMLHQEGTHLWSTAIERVIAVFAGGALGLVITFVFHLFYKPAPKTVETILPKEQSPV